MKRTATVINRIHIVNTHGMGDVVMSLPLILRLQRLYTGAQLTFTLKGALEEKLVRTFLGEACGTVLHRSGWLGAVRYLVRLWRLKPDLLVMCTGAEPTLKSVLISLFSFAPNRAGLPVGLGRVVYNLKPSVVSFSGKHKVQRHLALLEPLGGSSDHPYETRLRLPQHFLRQVRYIVEQRTGAGRLLIGISPGSGEAERHKRWPAAHFGGLVRLILDSDPGARVILFGDANERSLADKVALYAHAVNDPRLILTAGEFDIDVTAAIISMMNVFIANCSGLGHLAALLGVPVVGLYGPTDPDITGPFTPERKIVRQEMPCAPCYREGFLRGCGDPACMKDIPVQAAFDAMMALLPIKNGILRKST